VEENKIFWCAGTVPRAWWQNTSISTLVYWKMQMERCHLSFLSWNFTFLMPHLS